MAAHYLETTNIYHQPIQSTAGQVIAAPTLIKNLPLPVRKVIGHMGDARRIMFVLGVAPGSVGKK